MIFNFNKLYCNKEVLKDIQDKYFSIDEEGESYLDLEKLFDTDGSEGEWGCDGQPSETEVDEDGIYFVTEGFPLDGIYYRLARLYPNQKLMFKFAFEHPNDGVGMIIFDCGKKTHEDWYEENSPKERETYTELTGFSSEDYYGLGGYKPVSDKTHLKNFIKEIKNYDNKELVRCYLNALRYYSFGGIKCPEEDTVVEEYEEEILNRIKNNMTEKEFSKTNKHICIHTVFPARRLSTLDDAYMRGKIDSNYYFNEIQEPLEKFNNSKEYLEHILEKYGKRDQKLEEEMG